MTRGVARIAGFHGTLTIAVGTLLLWLLVGPGVVVNLVTDQRSVFIQDYPPPTELVQRTGYRAIWGGRASAELAVQPGDAMLEVVIPASTPFASHYPEPLYQAAFMTRRSVAAVVVTLDLTVGGEFGTGTYVEGARARIDEIWFDRSESPLTVGSFIWIAAHSGTRVWAWASRRSSSICPTRAFLGPVDGICSSSACAAIATRDRRR